MWNSGLQGGPASWELKLVERKLATKLRNDFVVSQIYVGVFLPKKKKKKKSPVRQIVFAKRVQHDFLFHMFLQCDLISCLERYFLPPTLDKPQTARQVTLCSLL